jgi:hypothetical protein
LLVNVDAVVAGVDAIMEDEEDGGEGREDRLGVDGERRERDRDWLAVNGSLVDGSGCAGCGAMRANEEGWIRRRADGFYSIELARPTAVLIIWLGYLSH